MASTGDIIACHVIGETIGHYQVTGNIGRGGMGEVFAATDTRLKRRVALKVLPRQFSSDSERLRRFEREARAASALNHPNIVTIYDVCVNGDTPYIAMELVEGRSLRNVLSAGPLPAAQIRDLAAQLAAGLAKAHEANIVHRDLKPENVIVSDDGFLKILDFGLAKLTTTSDRDTKTETMTRAGYVMGTPAYMSPEQAAGRSMDFRSDQFSFGVILYEMASGRNPFLRDTTTGTLAAIIEREAEPLQILDAAVSAMVERCLREGPGTALQLDAGTGEGADSTPGQTGSPEEDPGTPMDLRSHFPRQRCGGRALDTPDETSGCTGSPSAGSRPQFPQSLRRRRSGILRERSHAGDPRPDVQNQWSASAERRRREPLQRRTESPTGGGNRGWQHRRRSSSSGGRARSRGCRTDRRQDGTDVVVGEIRAQYGGHIFSSERGRGAASRVRCRLASAAPHRRNRRRGQRPTSRLTISICDRSA